MSRFSVISAAGRHLSQTALAPSTTCAGAHWLSRYGSFQRTFLLSSHQSVQPNLHRRRTHQIFCHLHGRHLSHAVQTTLERESESKSHEVNEHMHQQTKALDGNTSSADTQYLRPFFVPAFKDNEEGEDEIKHNSEFQGFWSLQQYEHGKAEKSGNVGQMIPFSEDTAEDDGTVVLQEESVGSIPDHLDTNQSREHTFESLWAATPRQNKSDLSYWNVFDGEKASEPPLPRQAGDHFAFRAGPGGSVERRQAAYFMRHIYHQTLVDDDLSDDLARSLLRHRDFVAEVDKQNMNHVAQVMSWSWVLLADHDLSVKRLVALCERQSQQGLAPVPLWVVLQILRAERIHPDGLEKLLVLIDRSRQWSWLGDTVMHLTVRLLRHAREGAPGLFETITNTFLRLLDLRFEMEKSNRDLGKIAHWCNRVLSLLAIPCDNNPFKSMLAQQVSQLIVVKYMQDHSPQIPLSREGYRAIARLQLMHAKTSDEIEWARAKASTWPPWEERLKMGAASQPKEYPGQQSRVQKVLARMRESGYTPYDFDLAIQVLAGQDTDRSPTIQLRRSATTVSIPTPWLPGSSGDPASPPIWTARILSTRSVREAWMCFCSYDDLTQGKPQSVEVYAAMFQKLMARMISTPLDTGSLPGDGTEVYPDPELTRDRVYIPEDVPSVSDLFSRMIGNGVKPTTRLLSELLNNETSLTQGLHYISEGLLEENKRVVLASPRAYPLPSVAESLQGLPNHLVSAYVGFLARPHAREPGAQPRGFVGTANLKGPGFVKLLLEEADVKDISIWNVYLKSILRHSDTSEAGRHREFLGTIWLLMCDTILQLQRRQMTPSFKTFSQVGPAALRIQTWTSGSAFTRTSWSDPQDITRKMFMLAAGTPQPLTKGVTAWQAFCNHQSSKDWPSLRSVPTGDDIENMVWLIGTHSQLKASTSDDILALLRWTHRYRSQILADGRRITRHNLASVRLFLEGLWIDHEAQTAWGKKIKIALAEQVQEAKHLCEELGPWPTASYMDRYLVLSDVRVAWMRTKLRLEKERRDSEPGFRARHNNYS